MQLHDGGVGCAATYEPSIAAAASGEITGRAVADRAARGDAGGVAAVQRQKHAPDRRLARRSVKSYRPAGAPSVA